MNRSIHSPSDDDPLYGSVALDHLLRLPVAGVRVAFRSNSADVCDAMAESFGMWKQLEAWPELIGTAEVRVSVIVHQGAEGPPGLAGGLGPGGRAGLSFRMPDSERVIVHTPGSFGIADTRRRDAVAYVTPDLIADRARFRRGFLEMLTLTLVTVEDRLPIHASMIARDGVAIMLAGPSGLGKSTIAYQARRAGWTLLADDGVYVQTEPVLRYWGMPRHVLLSADAGTWFPEFAIRSPTLEPNGKLKFQVDHEHDWLTVGPPTVDRVAVCLLARTQGIASLERVGPEPLIRALTNELASVYDLYGDAPSRVIPRVCESGGWRLTLSRRPADAEPLIEELARAFSAAPP